jgi:glycine/D-amino acid oxidase-like deaminating enzyme
MQFKSYWHDTAPIFTSATPGEVEGTFDVAIIGGGFTGLSAARSLAKGGAKVVVLEAQHVGFGGSGRNGGHLNNGIAHSFISAKEHLGVERASALYRAYDDSVDTIAAIVAEEGIDCSFRRAGKLKLASKPAHFDAIAKNFEVVHREIDADTALLSKAELQTEIGSDDFHGAMLSKKSGMMHMGRFVHGVAQACVRHGVTIFEKAPVTDRTEQGGIHRLTTPRGFVEARNVVVATNAYTSGPFDYFRRRIIPVGSFIVATRPLSETEVASVMPGNRTCVTSMNIGNYFRLSPDNRLIFGGRARFSATSDARSDAKSGEILKSGLAEIFPQLRGVDIDYCWGGLVGMTSDRFPRAGEVEGLNFAMGYSGHGAQMSIHMGTLIADKLLGKPDRNPLKGLDWNAVPGYSGKPWFLPVVGFYYKMLDKFQ